MYVLRVKIKTVVNQHNMYVVNQHDMYVVNQHEMYVVNQHDVFVAMGILYKYIRYH